MKKVVVASSNNDKLYEIRQILSPISIELISMGEIFHTHLEIAETGSTFAENAHIKADMVYEKSGLWVLADDSGLEVDALNGRPGVYSARFAGENAGAQQNNLKLLKEMQNIPIENRTARFRCVIVLKTGPESYLQTEGVCEGKIGLEPEGTLGFGYDPLFIVDGYNRTFAQLSSSEKHKVSHRGRALKKLVEKLDVLLR